MLSAWAVAEPVRPWVLGAWASGQGGVVTAAWHCGPGLPPPESPRGWHGCVTATTGGCALTPEKDGVQGGWRRKTSVREPLSFSAAGAGQAGGTGPWPCGPGCLLGGLPGARSGLEPRGPFSWQRASGVKAARRSWDWWDRPRIWSIRGVLNGTDFDLEVGLGTPGAYRLGVDVEVVRLSNWHGGRLSLLRSGELGHRGGPVQGRE